MTDIRALTNRLAREEGGEKRVKEEYIPTFELQMRNCLSEQYHLKSGMSRILHICTARKNMLEHFFLARKDRKKGNMDMVGNIKLDPDSC
jgi:hypothetical protein